MTSNFDLIDVKWRKWICILLFIAALSGATAARRRRTKNNYFQSYSMHTTRPAFSSIQHPVPAGILLRITQNGFDEISSAVRNSLRIALPGLTIRNVGRADVLRAHINIEELKVATFDSFDHFRLMLQQNTGEQIRLSARIGRLALTVTVSTNRKLIRRVTFTVDASDIEFDIGFSFSASPGGELRVAIVSCDFSIGRVKIFTERLEGSGLIWQLVRSVLRSNLRRFVNRRLCTVLQNHVPGEVDTHLKHGGNENLARGDAYNLGLIGSKGNFGKPNRSLMSIFAQKLEKALRQLYINFGLVESPSVQNKGSTVFINIPLNGEIHAGLKSRTNLARHTMDDIGMNGNKMLYIGINEFVVNTLLNSLYHIGALNFTLNSTNAPKLENFLQTDCEVVCLGTLLPEVADAHPDKTFSLMVAVNKAPFVHFSARGIHLNFTAAMSAYVDDVSPKVYVMRSDIVIEASVTLRVSNHRLHGTVKVHKFLFKPKDELNFSETVVELINEVTGKAIETELNRIFEAGVPLPTFDLFSMTNGAITHVFKGLWIELNFHFNNAALAKLIRKILSHSSSNNR
ncbi:LBP [Trichuris trichiura]|uniref:LBP n=1 Tax=Trichuris trichiura TaxID=36087 RepID=A0A077ZJA1_TRITR|nr:LBP [Trichuris trichiura]